MRTHRYCLTEEEVPKTFLFTDPKTRFDLLSDTFSRREKAEREEAIAQLRDGRAEAVYVIFGEDRARFSTIEKLWGHLKEHADSHRSGHKDRHPNECLFCP